MVTSDGKSHNHCGYCNHGIIQNAYQFIQVPASLATAVLAAVRTAIFRLDPSAGTMTSTHLQFIRLCLQGRALVEAVPLLEATIHSFPAAKSSSIDGTLPCLPHTDSTGYISYESGLTAKLSIADIQEYFLLSATIWIGLRRWEDALLNLELVLASPTQGSPSGLMLEAYQKWTIVGCLINGRVSSHCRQFIRSGIDSTLDRQSTRPRPSLGVS